MNRVSTRNFSLHSRWISVEKTRWFTMHANAQYYNKTHIFPNTFPWIYYTPYVKKKKNNTYYISFSTAINALFSTNNATDGLFRSKPDVYKSPSPSAFKEIGLVFTAVTGSRCGERAYNLSPPASRHHFWSRRRVSHGPLCEPNRTLLVSARFTRNSNYPTIRLSSIGYTDYTLKTSNGLVETTRYGYTLNT